MKYFLSLLSIMSTLLHVQAQTNVWQPSPGHSQTSLWPGTPPDSRPVAGPEYSDWSPNPVAGKPRVIVGRVTEPTLTLYSPTGTNTGIAVLVFPGGAYHQLAIDHEGFEVCGWLASRGITGILVKYRVPGAQLYTDSGFPKSGPFPESPIALEDAQRAMGLVRSHAAEWHVDSRKIGVLGFSAGGHLVAAVSTHFDQRLYSPVDGADRVSCRPDFVVSLYPGYMMDDTNEFKLTVGIPITTNTPPTLIVHAEDDPAVPVDYSLVYYHALKKAGVPAEMHLFAEGGHGFGGRQTKLPITHWPQLMETWLGTIGMISR